MTFGSRSVQPPITTGTSSAYPLRNTLKWQAGRGGYSSLPVKGQEKKKISPHLITVERTLAHFTTHKGWFKKLSISEIVYFRNLY